MSYEILSNSNPDDEAIRLTDSPQTRMKPGFVRDRSYRRSVRFRGKRISEEPDFSLRESGSFCFGKGFRRIQGKLPKPYDLMPCFGQPRDLRRAPPGEIKR